MRWRAQRASFLTCWGEITCASQNVDRLPGVPLARQGGWGAVPSTDTNTRVLWVPSAKGLLCGDPTKGPGCRLCTWRSAHCFLSRDGHSLPAERAGPVAGGEEHPSAPTCLSPCNSPGPVSSPGKERAQQGFSLTADFLSLGCSSLKPAWHLFPHAPDRLELAAPAANYFWVAKSQLLSLLGREGQGVLPTPCPSQLKSFCCLMSAEVVSRKELEKDVRFTGVSRHPK